MFPQIAKTANSFYFKVSVEVGSKNFVYQFLMHIHVVQRLPVGFLQFIRKYLLIIVVRDNWSYWAALVAV